MRWTGEEAELPLVNKALTELKQNWLGKGAYSVFYTIGAVGDGWRPKTPILHMLVVEDNPDYPSSIAVDDRLIQVYVHKRIEK